MKVATKVSSEMFYPNFIQGFEFGIELLDGSFYRITDMTDKIFFSVAETTKIKEIKIVVKKNHAPDGFIFKPCLTSLMNKRYVGVTTSEMHDGVIYSSITINGQSHTVSVGDIVKSQNNNKFYLAVSARGDFEEYKLDTVRGLIPYPFIDHTPAEWYQHTNYMRYSTDLSATVNKPEATPQIRGDLYYGKGSKKEKSKVTGDTTFVLANETSNINLTANTNYVLSPGDYDANHYDVAFGYENLYNAGFFPSSKCPILWTRMYMENNECDGVIWEKQLTKKRYMIGNSTLDMNGTLVSEHAGTYKCSKGHTHTIGFNGQNSLWTKNYFLHVETESSTQELFFVVSNNLQEFVITEFQNIVQPGYFVVSRKSDKGMFCTNNGTGTIYQFEIGSDGKVTIDQLTKPTNLRDLSSQAIHQNLFLRFAGAYIYRPIEDDPANIYDEPTKKPFYGFDCDGNMYNTGIWRWVSDPNYYHVTGNFVSGYKEDCSWGTYNVTIEGVTIQHTICICSDDGFKTKTGAGELVLPNYSFVMAYDVPHKGIRLVFQRYDIALRKNVRDVYDKNGNLLKYNIETQVTIPIMGWEAHQNFQEFWPDGNYKFTWNGGNTAGSGSYLYSYPLVCATDGSKPIQPDLFVFYHSVYYLSGVNLVIVCHLDDIGTPKQPSFAFVTGSNYIYIQDCFNGNSNHFTKMRPW